jgi:hypothetical protein
MITGVQLKMIGAFLTVATGGATYRYGESEDGVGPLSFQTGGR